MKPLDAASFQEKQKREIYPVANGCIGAKVRTVIETVALKGNDTKESPLRLIQQYWSLEGELLAEKDAFSESEKTNDFYDDVALTH